MPEESRTRRLAILIDADNTSPRIAAGLFEEVAKFGEASVRRIYGDFSGQRLKSWADILQKYAIDPYQQFAYTTGKNASDIAGLRWGFRFRPDPHCPAFRLINIEPVKNTPSNARSRAKRARSHTSQSRPGGNPVIIRGHFSPAGTVGLAGIGLSRRIRSENGQPRSG
jgi:hypothetical protein